MICSCLLRSNLQEKLKFSKKFNSFEKTGKGLNEKKVGKPIYEFLRKKGCYSFLT